jgi:hypothetical protein
MYNRIQSAPLAPASVLQRRQRAAVIAAGNFAEQKAKALPIIEAGITDRLVISPDLPVDPTESTAAALAGCS